MHSSGTHAAFERFVCALASDGLRVDHLILHDSKAGMSSSVFLDFADDGHFDLPAAGSVRHGRRDRVPIRSVSADLPGNGRHSMRIVPSVHD